MAAVMNVDPVGLPAALKAWRQREPDPVLTVHCGAEADCGALVGAVYRTPHGTVVESRTSVPETVERDTSFDVGGAGLAAFAADLGLVGLLDDVETPAEPEEPAGPEESVRAQIDLLHTEIYWHDPRPLCPTHGELRVDQARLAEAVVARRERYDALP